MKYTKKIIVKLTAYLIIGLVAILITNQVLFTHTHKFNEETVVHAHPYDKSEDNQQSKKHSHTEAELFFFAHFNLLFPLFVLAFLILRNLKENKQLTVFSINYNQLAILPHNGRDPPLFLSQPLS